MTPPIIGISGKKRHGKDTAAEALIEHRGFTRYAFADIMKRAALALDPIVDTDYDPLDGQVQEYRLSSLVEMYGWEGAKEYPEVRRTLQRLGTELGRETFGQDFWVDHTMAEIEAAGVPAVVTDVRFPNEADAIRNAGGYLIRVHRPGLVAPVDEHPSETALDDYPYWDSVVVNDRTIAALQNDAAFAASIYEIRRTSADMRVPVLT